jgi:hypothetical protein
VPEDGGGGVAARALQPQMAGSGRGATEGLGDEALDVGRRRAGADGCAEQRQRQRGAGQNR